MSFAIGSPVPWPLPPDWSEPVRETLAWRTDVLQAVNGTRQARQLRMAPRRGLAFNVLAAAQERRLLDALRADHGARQWCLPIWPDGQRVAAQAAGALAIACDTLGRDFVAGGQALLWAGLTRWELVSIDTVGDGVLGLASALEAAWAAETRLYPVRTARLRGAPERALSGEVGRLRVEMEIDEPCDWTAAAPEAMYRGAPVLEWRRDESADPGAAYAHLLAQADAECGPVSVYDVAGQAFRTQDHRLLVHGRAQQAALRSLLYWLAGRVGALWVPSGMQDLELAASIGAGATSLVVAWAGYATFGRQQTNRRDIRIELRDGTVLYRRITGSTAGALTETLVLDSALGQAVTPADVRSISFMAFCAQAGDVVEIDHLTDADGTAACALRFEAIRHEASNTQWVQGSGDDL